MIRVKILASSEFLSFQTCKAVTEGFLISNLVVVFLVESRMNLLTESVSPMLTSDKLELLKAHKILNSLDFVQYSNDKIANLIGQNVSEIIKIKDQILAANNSKPLRADKMYEIILKRTVIIKSGINV